MVGAVCPRKPGGRQQPLAGKVHQPAEGLDRQGDVAAGTQIIYVEKDTCIECVIEDVLQNYLEEYFPPPPDTTTTGPVLDASVEPGPDTSDATDPADTEQPIDPLS